MSQGGKVYSYTISTIQKKTFVRPFSTQFALKIRGGGAGPLDPSAESATEKDKKKAEKPQKNGKEFERPLESIGLKNWLSKESKSFKNRENIK